MAHIIDGNDRLIFGPGSCEGAQRDPLLALSRANWLASCGGMFRSRSVTTAYFERGAQYFEWTVLAYRLASVLRPAFLSDVTFRVNDTAGSMSKTNGQHNAEVAALRSVLTLQLPTAVRRSVREKLGRASHAHSSASLDRGEISAAWRHHLASLTEPGGWKYVLYTRKLLASSLRRHLRGAESHAATIVPLLGLLII